LHRPNSDFEIQLVAEIVVAYLSKNEVDRKDVPQFIADVRAALIPEARPPTVSALQSIQVEESQPTDAVRPPKHHILSEVPMVPAVPAEDSVSDTYIVCLEDGGRFRSLRRHLMAKYGMTPDDYRRKWNLPPDYPMVAPSYARDRSAVAKRIGLGKNKPTTPARRRPKTSAT
jgi:predicted transcriptional regulator